MRRAVELSTTRYGSAAAMLGRAARIAETYRVIDYERGQEQTGTSLTRDASKPQARALADIGAEVIQGDMTDRDSLVAMFKGTYGAYSAQNPMISGHQGEILQGKNVADVAKETGVQRLVYGSAAPGVRGTGVGAWESKLEIEAHMRQLGCLSPSCAPWPSWSC
jgi:hypothetical protein